MQIVWEKTGDWLDITPTNPEFALYWVTELSRNGVNKFDLLENDFQAEWIPLLNTHVLEVNRFLVDKCKITALQRFEHANFVDQVVLNDLHRTWIGLIVAYPKLVTLLKKHSDTLYTHWNQINKKIHAIELHFNCVYRALQYWEAPNIFGTEILNFNQCQIRLMFSQEGRSSYNKWLNFDDNSIDIDTNDYLQVGSEVCISLDRPLYCSAPENFVDYCNKKSIPVVGKNLNIGNFTNYESKLTELRQVYLRNTTIENNTALFRS